MWLIAKGVRSMGVGRCGRVVLVARYVGVVGMFGFVVGVARCCIEVDVARRVVDTEVVAVVLVLSRPVVDGCLVARGLWRSILLLPCRFNFGLMIDVVRRVRRWWRLWRRGSNCKALFFPYMK